MTTSPAEHLLSVQLEQAGIPFEREYRFAPEDWCREHGYLTPTGRPRKWRADFMVTEGWMVRNSHGQLVEMENGRILIEIDGGGYVAGRHSRGAGMEKDAEKQSAAAILGYRVIRATPKQVEDGRCLQWIKEALGIETRDAA